jgi:hypothetical protein
MENNEEEQKKRVRKFVKTLQQQSQVKSQLITEKSRKKQQEQMKVDIELQILREGKSVEVTKKLLSALLQPNQEKTLAKAKKSIDWIEYPLLGLIIVIGLVAIGYALVLIPVVVVLGIVQYFLRK